MKHLLLLGGGPAHVQFLRSLARSGLPTAHATMISPFHRPPFEAILPALVAGHATIEERGPSLPDLAQAGNVQFIQAEAARLNASERTLSLRDGRVISYDILSLDPGPSMNRDLIPGARAYALFVRPVEHFTKLWGDLLDLASKKPLSIVVLGAGKHALELALAFQFRFINQARVSLVTGAGEFLPGHLEATRQASRRALRRLGVTLIEEAFNEITASHVLLRGGGRLVCQAPIAAWDPDPPGWLAQSGLALDAQGFALTSPTLQSTSHTGVFAVGETAARTDFLSRVPHSSAHVARTLAINLRRMVSTGVLVRDVPQKTSLSFLDCSDYRAIASWGPWAIHGRWVWTLKNWLAQRRQPQ